MMKMEKTPAMMSEKSVPTQSAIPLEAVCHLSAAFHWNRKPSEVIRPSIDLL